VGGVSLGKSNKVQIKTTTKTRNFIDKREGTPGGEKKGGGGDGKKMKKGMNVTWKVKWGTNQYFVPSLMKKKRSDLRFVWGSPS